MATSIYSVRTLILAAFLLGAVCMSTFAADGLGDPWFDRNQACSSCGDGESSACYDGIDVPYCGDMSPTAMLPDGRWYFQANGIAFRRHAAQNEVFQTRNQNSFAIDPVGDSAGTLTRSESVESVLSIDDLTFQNSAGYRLLLGWKLAEKYAVEFSYFDLNDWDEAKAVSDATDYAETAQGVPGNVTLDIFGNPVPNVIADHSLFSPFSDFGNPANDDFDYNDLASIRYRSSLDNVEINVRHWVTKRPSRLAVSVLWGGRHNAVRERFTYFSTSPTPVDPTTNTVNLRTANDLWGAQIGAQVDFCWDPGWHTEFEVKGGVAHNRAVYEGVYDIQNGAGGGLVNYTDRVDKDVTSWTAEMRLTLVYQFGQHLTTHVGYEALMLSRLALASQNFETDLSILAAPNSWVLDNGGTVVYHGPSAGLTLAW
jgi:putative beta barrel porin BBP7